MATEAPRHAPPWGWRAIDGELSVGGLPLSKLARRVGQTPFFAYDRALLDARVAELRAILPPAFKLHYAVKANPMPALVCHMASRVDGLDVASGRELKTALDSGMSAHDVSFAGPGKREAELAQAVAGGVLLNVESETELERVAAICARTGDAARVALRVNPDFELKQAGMKMSGGPKQFGTDAERIAPLARHAVELGLAFEGFHIFSGSQNLRASAIVEAQAKSYQLALRLAQEAGLPVRTLNLGGGFGIPYFPGETHLELAPIGDSLHAIAARAGREMPGAELVIELGRYLVGEAGIYVTRVLDRKDSRGQVFLVCDGGLNHQLAASGNFGQVLRKNYPLAIGNRYTAEATEAAMVVGPLCTPLDLLGDRMPLPRAEIGDLVVVFQSGAYGLTASPREFLSHPDAVEVLV
jgi:diaminopimelate decarboxylase